MSAILVKSKSVLNVELCTRYVKVSLLLVD